MAQHKVRRQATSYRLVILLAILGGLVWASPSEQTIGDLVKVVYVHGALVRAAELVFLAGGALGLLYLLRKNDLALRLSGALQKTAALFWFLSFLVSIYVMRMAWGGINWSEPRFLATGRVLSVAAIAMAVSYLLERPKVVAAAGVFMAAIVAMEMFSAGLMLHPANPIGTSPSPLTKTYYYAIVLVILALAVEVTRLLLPRRAIPRTLYSSTPSPD